MLKKDHMSLAHNDDRLLYKKGESGRNSIFVAKVVIYWLLAGTFLNTANFTSILKSHFELGESNEEADIEGLGFYICRFLKNVLHWGWTNKRHGLWNEICSLPKFLSLKSLLLSVKLTSRAALQENFYI